MNIDLAFKLVVIICKLVAQREYSMLILLNITLTLIGKISTFECEVAFFYFIIMVYKYHTLFVLLSWCGAWCGGGVCISISL